MDREEMERIEKAWRQRTKRHRESALKRRQLEMLEGLATQNVLSERACEVVTEEVARERAAKERRLEKVREAARRQYERKKLEREAAGNPIKPRRKNVSVEDSYKTQREAQRRYYKKRRREWKEMHERYDEHGRLTGLLCEGCAEEGLGDGGWQHPLLFNRRGNGYERLCREHADRERKAQALKAVGCSPVDRGSAAPDPYEWQRELCREAAARREAARLRKMESEANSEK